MVVSVIIRDMECHCEIAVPLQPGTFLVALETGLSPRRLRHIRSSITSDFFFLSLTVTSDHDLERAWLLLFTCRGSMTRLFARMPTGLLGFTTLLLTVLMGVFTFSWFMTCLAASM